jgi:cytochrome P450
MQPPGPRSLLPFGLYLRYSRDPLGFLLELARDYGDAAAFRIGPQRIFFMNHPDLIKEVLVTQGHNFVKCRSLSRARKLLGDGLLTTGGEAHKRRRRLLQPAFHHGHLVRYGEIIIDRSLRLAERWREGRLDAHAAMTALTLEIAAKALFDAALEAEELSEAFNEALRFLGLMPSPFAPLFDRLPLPQNRRFEQARARLDAVIERLVSKRQHSEEGAFLGLLLAAGLTGEELRDEAMTFLLAGHETTANALAWSWYLLARHPEVEARLHAELEAVLGGERPTTASFGRLSYTRMVFAEALRLYPPAFVIGRRALKSCTVGGYRVPAGAIVNISQLAVHRDPRFYPEPERFDPERWRPEAQAARPKFAYFPFGGGARVCIGEGSAWLEGVLVLATLAQRFSLGLTSKQPVEAEPLITLRPRGGLTMLVQRR